MKDQKEHSDASPSWKILKCSERAILIHKYLTNNLLINATGKVQVKYYEK